MRGAIYDKRVEIHARLLEVADEITSGDLTVHRYPPPQLTGLAVYVDMPRVTPAVVGVPTVVATFPVVAAFDGDDTAQTAAMDEVQAVLWDAFSTLDGYAVESIDPEPIDVGGARVRALALLVAADLTTTTLCPGATSLSH